MSPAFSTRRRAEQFEALLEGTLTETPSAELASLLALVDEVRAVPEVEPRADFAASLRERLMAEAPTALAMPASDATAKLSVGHRTPTRPRRERRLAVAIAAASIVGATGVSAVASQGALPGDTLYPVKRLVEDARSSMTMGDTARADVLLSQARTRLEEAGDLGRRDDVDSAAIKQAIDDFRDSADSASAILLADYADHSDEQAIGSLRTFTAQGVTTLSQLADLLPESVHGALVQATNTLLAIDHSAAEACPSCGGGIAELPATLTDLLTASAAAVGPSDAAAAAPSVAGNGTGRSPRTTPTSPAPSADTLPGQLTDPLENLTGGSTGGGSGTRPTAPPTSLGDATGQVGGVVGGTVGGLGGAVGGLGDKVGGPLGDTLGGAGAGLGQLGDTVDGTLGGIGGTLDDVTGGLTGGATPKP